MIQDKRKNPDPVQKLIDLPLADSSLKMSSKAIGNFLRYCAHRQTDRYENVTSLAEVCLHWVSNFVESSFQSSFELLEFLLAEIFCEKFTGWFAALY